MKKLQSEVSFTLLYCMFVQPQYTFIMAILVHLTIIVNNIYLNMPYLLLRTGLLLLATVIVTSVKVNLLCH